MCVIDLKAIQDVVISCPEPIKEHVNVWLNCSSFFVHFV